MGAKPKVTQYLFLNEWSYAVLITLFLRNKNRFEAVLEWLKYSWLPITGKKNFVLSFEMDVDKTWTQPPLPLSSGPPFFTPSFFQKIKK